MSHFQSLFAVSLLLLACSCQTHRPAGTVATAEVLPEKFEYHCTPSPTFGGRTSLIWEDGSLVRRSYELKATGSGYTNVLSKTERIVPAREQWIAFWQRVEDMQIWSLRSLRGRTHEVCDGGAWHLEMVYRGRHADIRTVDAAPQNWEAVAEGLEKAIAHLTRKSR